MTTKVYLAARYTRRLELVEYARQLERLGYTVTSRWLAGEHQWDGMAVETAQAYEERGEIPPLAWRFAQDDLEDVTAADLLIAFTERPRDPLSQADVDEASAKAGDPVMLTALLNIAAKGASRGGRHVELGLAMGLDKRVVVCGPAENVFHLLLPRLETWDAVLEQLRSEAEQRDVQAGVADVAGGRTRPWAEIRQRLASGDPTDIEPLLMLILRLLTGETTAKQEARDTVTGWLDAAEPTREDAERLTSKVIRDWSIVGVDIDRDAAERYAANYLHELHRLQVAPASVGGADG